MLKGVKALQKHVGKIEAANNKTIDKEVKAILKLKGTRLSDISQHRTHSREILVHKDTNNFPVTKQKLLNKMADVHREYPFITISFDANMSIQPQKKGKHYTGIVRRKTATNSNRLIMTINWEDYMQYALRSLPSSEEESITGIVPITARVGIKQKFEETKAKNLKAVYDKIQAIFKTAQNHTTTEITEDRVRLVEKTMSQEVTRNHILFLVNAIVNQSNGIIEMYDVGHDILMIRVHWNIYLSQIAAQERRNIVVPLIPTNDKIPIENGFLKCTPDNDNNYFSSEKKKKNDSQFEYPPEHVDREIFEPSDDFNEESSGRRRRRHRTRHNSAPRVYLPNQLNSDHGEMRIRDIEDRIPLLDANDMPSPPSDDPHCPIGQEGPVGQPTLMVTYPPLVAEI